MSLQPWHNNLHLPLIWDFFKIKIVFLHIQLIDEIIRLNLPFELWNVLQINITWLLILLRPLHELPLTRLTHKSPKLKRVDIVEAEIIITTSSLVAC